MTAAADIDFLSSIPSEVLQESGPYGRAYDLQLSLDRAQRELDWARENLYEDLDRQNREAQAAGHLGSFTSIREHVERDSRIVELRTRTESFAEQVTAVQAELGGIVFLPATDNLPKIEKQLKALNRKAGTIGTGEITLQVSDEKLVLHYAYEEIHGAHEGSVAHADFEHVFAILSGAVPQIPGFEFLASIVPTEHGNVVNKIPAIRYGMRHNLEDRSFEGGVEKFSSDTSQAGEALASIDLSRFLTTGDACEHCHKDRDRKDLYVVYNEATGETLQVGRTCLRDYMGSNDPEKVLKALEQYREVYRMMSLRGEREVLLTSTFLTHCAALVRKLGHYESGLGSMAVTNHRDMVADRRYKGEKTYVEPITADTQAAAAMLRWVRTEWEEDGEFPQKVKIALAGEAVNEKLYNIAGAVFAAYPRWVAGADRRVARQSAQEAAAERVHVGTVGQRETFELTVTNIKWVAGYAYNTEKPIISMTDADGNRLVWFASDLPRVADKDEYGPAVGGTYQVKATVKDHETHETYGKSTVITRCKFETTISEPEENNE